MSKVRFAHPTVVIVDRFNEKTGERLQTRATIAYQINKNEVRVGVAFTSLKDNFCRRTGREVSEKRLTDTPLSIPLLGAEKSPVANVLSYLKVFLPTLDLPGRPRELRNIVFA